MKILNKFTIQNLKLNKKRTIVTIIGIILSTALICGVIGLVASFQDTFIIMAKTNEGNYHTTFYDVPKEKMKYVQNNVGVDSYFCTSQIGYAYLKDSKNEYKPYISLLEYDKNALKNYGVNLIEGRVPENNSELLISQHIRENARVDLKVGDKITLEAGQRQLNDGTILTQNNPYLTGKEDDSGKVMTEEIINTTSKTYTIVGIMDRPNYTVEGFEAAGYTAITYMNETGGKANISVLYTNPKDYEEHNDTIMNSIDSKNIHVNRELLRYQGAMSENALSVLYGIAAVVIVIIVTSSVFVIRNSFSISVSEKNRQYGMMSSVGATAKQIRKNVLYEGFIIGLIGIPLGILGGVIAIIILLQIVNYLLKDMLMGLEFVYSLPPIPVLISIVISVVTIFLSSLLPAIKASRISPIESIRGNNDIKIKSKKLKTNRLIKKMFGIGGVIASKNLKRSKKKYRTTVISIVISIVIFISLSSFISYGNKASSLYYTKMDFNVIVSNLDVPLYREIIKIDNVDNYGYYYESSAQIDAQKYGAEKTKNLQEDKIAIIAYNNEYFKQYVKKVGLREEDYKTSAILIDEIITYNEDNTRNIDKLYSLKEGDNAIIKFNEKDRNVVISKNTDIRPIGLEATYYATGMLIVSEDFIGEIKDDTNVRNLFINSNNATQLENTLNDLVKNDMKYIDMNVVNYETLVNQQNRMVLVISIFLYGFITVISLIGVTNIFNTITTNMILRSKEFAMLKSVGMTIKEFNRMIRLESILYGLKSLLIGIPIGILGSYFIYQSFAQDVNMGYTLPTNAILISIVFVFIIVGLTMKYSLNKINKQNIIETIRKDNI